MYVYTFFFNFMLAALNLTADCCIVCKLHMCMFHDMCIVCILHVDIVMNCSMIAIIIQYGSTVY